MAGYYYLALWYINCRWPYDFYILRNLIQYKRNLCFVRYLAPNNYPPKELPFKLRWKAPTDMRTLYGKQ